MTSESDWLALYYRVEALENQMKYYHNLEADARTDRDIWNVIKKLEEWRKQKNINHDTNVTLAAAWMQDITDLKEWKINISYRLAECEKYITKLEESKQDICNWGDQKVIDKQVWEEIKNISCRKYWAGGYGRAIQSELIRLIKKAEPEWEPDKK